MKRESRRRFLQLVSIGWTASIAGCQQFSPLAPQTETEPTPTIQFTSTPTPDPWLGEQSRKLSAVDGGPGDWFGSSIAVSADGGRAVVGAYLDNDPDAEDAGAAYVFSRSGGAWSKEAKLALEDPGHRDVFGVSVALSADGATALVGARGAENSSGDGAGSAYVYVESGDSWSRQAKLTPADGDDEFGESVALSRGGETALIGARSDEDPNGRFAGAAYVFSRSGEGWTQEAKLAPGDSDSKDFFGGSVALSADGTTALVGAYLDEDPNGVLSGSAYVFSRSGGSWPQRAKLAPGDGDSLDDFAASVTLSADGTTALVGAPGEENPDGDRAGAAYLFSSAGSSWTERAKLSATDGDSEDVFGESVALSADGRTALVGAPGDEDPNDEDAGAAYLLSESDGSWTPTSRLVPDDGDGNDRFGEAVALESDGTTALIGARGDEDPNGSEAGSVYVFE